MPILPLDLVVFMPEPRVVTEKCAQVDALGSKVLGAPYRKMNLNAYTAKTSRGSTSCLAPNGGDFLARTMFHTWGGHRPPPIRGVDV